jgi:hypothetical protein
MYYENETLVSSVTMWVSHEFAEDSKGYTLCTNGCEGTMKRKSMS